MILQAILSTGLGGAAGVVPIREEETSFAPTAEFALFVAGALLTLLVVGFVIGLLVIIRKEEREAAAARADEHSEETS